MTPEAPPPQPPYCSRNQVAGRIIVTRREKVHRSLHRQLAACTVCHAIPRTGISNPCWNLCLHCFAHIQLSTSFHNHHESCPYALLTTVHSLHITLHNHHDAFSVRAQHHYCAISPPQLNMQHCSAKRNQHAPTTSLVEFCTQSNLSCQITGNAVP